jgi:hypothetical protein
VRVVKETTAIYNNPFCSPAFDCDLYLYGTNFCHIICRKESYEEPIKETANNFSVEEFEIFLRL